MIEMQNNEECIRHSLCFMKKKQVCCQPNTTVDICRNLHMWRRLSPNDVWPSVGYMATVLYQTTYLEMAMFAADTNKTWFMVRTLII